MLDIVNVVILDINDDISTSILHKIASTVQNVQELPIQCESSNINELTISFLEILAKSPEKVNVHIIGPKLEVGFYQYIYQLLTSVNIKDNHHKINEIIFYVPDLIKITPDNLIPLTIINHIMEQGLSIRLQEISTYQQSESIDHLQFMTFYYDIEAVSTDLEITKEDIGFIPQELRRTVENHGYVPEKFWYWDEESAVLWTKLIRSSRYNIATSTTKLLKESIPQFIEKISSDYGGAIREINFINLGVGTPQKDIIILDELANYLHNTHGGGVINYYPVDISFPLLEYTLRRVLTRKKEYRDLNVSLNIYPLIGDFEKLNEGDYQDLLTSRCSSDSIKLVSLLGNTLGNISERKFLENINSLLEDNGYLLVDVEYAYKVSDPELKSQYDTKAVFNFVFHPLELLRINRTLNERYIKDKKRLDVKVLERKSVRPIWYYYRKNRREVLISTIPNSKIVVLFYKTNNCYEKYIRGQRKRICDKILMAWSTKYSEPSFLKFLSDVGFEKLHTHKSKDNKYGIYLLKPMLPENVLD